MKSKVANENESRRITHLMVGMVPGLKILVSAVQSRPCPPFLSTSCPSVNFLRSEFVPRFVPTSGTLERIPAHQRTKEAKVIERWLPLIGRWHTEGPVATYLGSDPITGNPSGIAVCGTRITRGVIKVKVSFPSQSSVGRVALGYNPFGAYFSVGVGGYDYGFVLDECLPTRGWQAVKGVGHKANLEVGRAYEVRVEVRGERVKLEIDGVAVLEENLPYPLMGDQAGIFAFGDAEVKFEDGEVSPEAGSLRSASIQWPSLDPGPSDSEQDDLAEQAFSKKIYLRDLPQAVAFSAARHIPIALLVIDIDDFKQFNEEHGHQVGDEAIKRVASVLQETAQGRGRLYRFGGDEFVVLLVNQDEVELRATAERIRRALAGQAIVAVPRPIQVTIGGAVYPHAGADGGALLKAADDALRLAKTKGKNQTEIDGLDNRPPAE
jgi:diguanylate cyclase (GGDEF)-like protein